METMTPEQQRIAIAIVCGWTPEEAERGFKTRLTVIDGVKTSQIAEHIPDYLNDLNAMNEAEKVLKDKLPWPDSWQNYTRNLADAAGFSYWESDTTEETNTDYHAHICHATAAQRAEAFLKTLNLWKP